MTAFPLSASMVFLWGIIIGLALGLVTSFFAYRRDPGSIITRMIIGAFGGIIGAVIALWLAPASGAETLIAAAGAVLILAIYWISVGNRKAP